MQVLKVEPMFHYSDAHFITTEMWCRVFLDMLGERWIEEKLRTWATVNARVAVVLWE